ncbi:glucosaminidase domain-containing protein [Candidatus Saccharibacteria bacterium]|nr:glucosaminidase domain-containing protein [Candidatus Saccharibacteria bacterium]
MVILKSKAFLRAYVFLLAVFVGGMCAVSPTLALIESRYNLYSQNSIYFYDPDCSPIDRDLSCKLLFIFDIDGTLDRTAKYTNTEEIYDGVVEAFKWMEDNGIEYKIMTARNGDGYERGKSWVETEILDKIGTSKKADDIFYPHVSANKKAERAKADGATIVFEDKKETVKMVVEAGMQAVNVVLSDGSNRVEGDNIFHLEASYANFVSIVKQALANAGKSLSSCPASDGGGGGEGGYSNEDDKWDGSCTPVSTNRANWLSKYVDYIRSVASSNGLPWEMIPAQAFMESGGGVSEACPYNPLGLKGSPACDGSGHRSFGSYEEAFQYYVNGAHSVRMVKGKYPNDPYSAISYIQYGVPHGESYAQCSKEEYLKNPKHSCYGHNLGDPTPDYVKNVSSLICGIQKWAKDKGIPISSVTWKDYSGGGGEKTGDDSDDDDDEDEDEKAVDYCYNGGGEEDDDGYEDPKAGDLASYVKAWAWPDYHSPPYMQRMPAYAEYMDTVSTYNPCGGVDCGAFVWNIIRASGWDPNYASYSRNSSGQYNYLLSNWEKLDPKSTSDLKLGDVGYRRSGGHVILYVGNISGFNSKTASASDCTGVHRRAPTAGSESDNSILNNYYWFRKK